MISKQCDEIDETCEFANQISGTRATNPGAAMREMAALGAVDVDDENDDEEEEEEEEEVVVDVADESDADDTDCKADIGRFNVAARS